MRNTNISINDYNMVFPAGVCRMGNTNVTFYRLSGNQLWFDKKDIEFVLTGKNQHNLLGQYKDPKNHNKIYDTYRKETVEVISRMGVQNYLTSARSVSEENRFAFYTGVKNIPREEKIPEPVQIPFFKAEETKPDPYIKITQKNGKTEVLCTMEEKNKEERNLHIIQVLLNVVGELIAGKIFVRDTD